MNFKEKSRQRIDNVETNKTTYSEDPVEFVLLKLDSDEVVDLDVMIGAGPPGDLSRFPPRFQSLVTDPKVFVAMDGEEAYLLGRRYQDRYLVARLVEPKIWRELGRPSVYRISAELFCKDNTVCVRLRGLPEECRWQITHRGTLYKVLYE